MADTLRPNSSVCQGEVGSRDDDGRGKSLSLMREAITESRWKHGALAAAMKLPNEAYLSRMLSGEKPWTLRHIEALPDDIETIYYRLRSESLGLLVATPVDAETARRHLVSGLIGILAPRAEKLPMVKAELPTAARKRA